jgi:acyl carrier protein
VVAAVPSPAPVATAAPVAGAPVVAAARAGTTPGGRRLADVLIDAVVEKTGYPKEMLDLSMELEASLGIDSIKRVEIMSSLMGELPAGIEVDPAEIIALRTLGEIVEHLEGLAGKA